MLICILSFTHGLFYRVWDVRTGEMTNTLIHHCEAVLHLRFCDGIMVTCSKVGHLKWRFLVLTAWKSKTCLCCIVTSFELKVCYSLQAGRESHTDTSSFLVLTNVIFE